MFRWSVPSGVHRPRSPEYLPFPVDAPAGGRLTADVVVIPADPAYAAGCWRVTVHNGTDLPITRVRVFLSRGGILLQSALQDSFTLWDGESQTAHINDAHPADDVRISGHLFGVSFRDLLGTTWAKSGDGTTRQLDPPIDSTVTSSTTHFSV